MAFKYCQDIQQNYSNILDILFTIPILKVVDNVLSVSMSIVDDYEDPPELKKDIFWNLTEPELIEHPEIIDIQDTEKVEIEVKQECKNVFHHIKNGTCKDTLL